MATNPNDDALLATRPDLRAARDRLEAARDRIAGADSRYTELFRCTLREALCGVQALIRVLETLAVSGPALAPCGGDYAAHEPALDPRAAIDADTLDVLDALDRELEGIRRDAEGLDAAGAEVAALAGVWEPSGSFEGMGGLHDGQC